MVKHTVCKWTGNSGKEYKYFIWSLLTSFNANQRGNYIFTKQNDQGRWIPIYIGQGDLRERMANHHQATCISQKGATHLHVHLNENETGRLAEESDLLANYTNVYQPTGCNERVGG
jgi:hypothetical protein